MSLEWGKVFYYSANIISILSAGLLLVIYVQQGRNSLLQSACAVVMVLSAVLMFDHANHSHLFYPDLQVNTRTAPLRLAMMAVFITYLVQVTHAHLCFLMLHTCAQACGWPIFRMRKGSFLTAVYLSVSYLGPLLPCIYLFVQELDKRSRRTIHNAFHWIVYSPAWACRFPSCMFAYAGGFFVVYLLYRFVRLRVSTLDQKMATQLSPVHVSRITITAYVYLIIAMSSVYPLNSDSHYLDALIRARRASGHNYVIASFGFLMFIMFGFGSPAVRAYTAAYRIWFPDRNPVKQPEQKDSQDSSFGVLYNDANEYMGFEDALHRTNPEYPEALSERNWSSKKNSLESVSKTSVKSKLCHSHK